LVRKISIIFQVLLLLLFCTCSKKSTTTTVSDEFKEVFTMTKSITLPDTSGVSGLIVSCRYGSENTIYFSDFLSKSLYQVNLVKKSLSRIGRIGQGPEEYLGAYDFCAKGDTLYFNDNEVDRLQSINLKTNLINEFKLKLRIVHSKFIKMYKRFYFLNWTYTKSHYLFDDTGKKYFAIPRIFREIGTPRMPKSLIASGRDVFFINGFEPNIYRLNTLTGEESIIKIKGLDKAFKWEKIYGETKDDKFFDKIEEGFTTLSRLNFLTIQNKKYFLISTYSNSKERAKIIFVNMEGDIVLTLSGSKRYPLAAFNDKVFMLRGNGGYKVEFEEYKVNNFFNNINIKK